MTDEMKKALSVAPAKAEALAKATERLNLAITNAEVKIRELRLGVVARVALSNEEVDLAARRFLAWAKDHNQWRLLYEDGDEYEPLVNAPRNVRMKAVPLLPALFRRLVEAVDQEIAKVEDAVSSANALNDEINDFVKAKGK